ncbi:MAG: PIG-L deacetylase family protein [Thermodesulfobacteriota bacterium]
MSLPAPSYDLMVVAAHPDDAEFGAAGTIAAWTAAGRRVVYVVCTSGEKGSSDPAVEPVELAAVREEEQRAAARVLGVSEVVFLRHPDQGLEETPAFRRQLVALLRQYRPHTVFTSDPYRRYFWHRDHRIAGQVLLDAVFPYARDHLAYPELLAQGLAPHKVREVWLWAAETPNHWVDISATFPAKLKALSCHASQVRELPVTDLGSWLQERCQTMAQGTAYELAEAFFRAEAPP